MPVARLAPVGSARARRHRPRRFRAGRPGSHLLADALDVHGGPADVRVVPRRLLAAGALDVGEGTASCPAARTRECRAVHHVVNAEVAGGHARTRHGVNRRRGRAGQVGGQGLALAHWRHSGGQQVQGHARCGWRGHHRILNDVLRRCGPRGHCRQDGQYHHYAKRLVHDASS